MIFNKQYLYLPTFKSKKIIYVKFLAKDIQYFRELKKLNNPIFY